MVGAASILFIIISSTFLNHAVADGYIHVINAPLDEQQGQAMENSERDLYHGFDIDSIDLKDDEYELDSKILMAIISSLRQHIANPFVNRDDEFFKNLLAQEYEHLDTNFTEDSMTDIYELQPFQISEVVQASFRRERANADDVLKNKNSSSTEVTTDAVIITDLNGTETPDIVSQELQNFLEAERYYSDVGENEPMALNIKTNEVENSPHLSVCGTVNLNKIVDQLLEGLRSDIVERGFDKIPIPDIYESFTKKIGIIKLKGDFNATQGWAKNLSTIYRTADVIATSHGNTLSVECGFGLALLQFGYDNYQAHFMKLGPHGTVSATVAKNSILLNATVSWSVNKCKATLNSLVLNKLEGFQMQVTGLGPLTWLSKDISSWIFEKYSAQIKEKVEDTLKEVISKKLESFDCRNVMA